MIAKLLFLFTESFRALLRTKLSAIISSVTISITLVIFSLAYFTYINLLGYSYNFKSKYKIEVFFDSNLNDQNSRDLFNSILILDGIEQGEYINKERASEIFKQYFNEDVVDIIGENPLPCGGSYDISENYRTSKKMISIIANIRRIEGVDVASFQQGVVSRVDSIIENILGISLILGCLIFIIAVILVSNTIRLIIHSKRESIETMHLLGATNNFIKLPFVLEGVFQGLLGSAISVIILYLLHSLLVYLLEPFGGIEFKEPPNIIFYNILFGLLLALIGSYRGISKYLPK